MNIKEKIQPFKVLDPIAKVGLAGFAWGVVGGIGITWINHRWLAHHSITPHPILEKAVEFDQRTIALNPRIWAAVHGSLHHQIPDATLAPFYRIARAVNWMRVNPERAGGIAIPETFPFLDPYVDRFKFEDVMVIGNMAIELLEERMGDMYKEPEKYTPGQLKALLNPKEPAYWNPRKKHRGKYTQEDIADLLLGDPHSPVRVPPPDLNGVRFILTRRTGLYNAITDLLETHPQLMPKDLQTEDGEVRKYGKSDLALGFVIPSIATFIARREYTPRGVLKAVAAGSAANLIRIGLIIGGGRLVNSLGHAGMPTEEGLAKAIQSPEYKPKLYPDGTIATDSSKSSFLGGVIHEITFGEVGGQQYHHEYPGEVAYTPEKGFKAWREDLWSSLTSALAQSKYFPLINPGDNFNLKPGERRPDQPHPAVEMIQRLRAEQLTA